MRNAKQVVAIGVMRGGDVEIRPTGHKLTQYDQKGRLRRVIAWAGRPDEATSAATRRLTSFPAA